LYYGVDEVSGREKKFLAWYKTHTSDLFDNRLVLEAYGQDDVTVLQACRVFRHEFLEIGNIEVLLEYLTIASACNSVAAQVFEARH